MKCHQKKQTEQKTVQTLIRLLLKEKVVLILHCLHKPMGSKTLDKLGKW